ncbi:MAG: hypothetical protein AAF657_40750, partial [Acidobacteriota bacterium]
NTYPTAVSKQPGAASDLEAAVGGDVADHLARSVLNLPLFAHITDSEVDEVLTVMERAMAAVAGASPDGAS